MSVDGPRDDHAGGAPTLAIILPVRALGGHSMMTIANLSHLSNRLAFASSKREASNK